MSIKVYISGKMTGIQDLNVRKFREAESRLREKGFIPVNPHNIHPVNTYHYTWADYMRADIKALCDCQVIAVLDDWQDSPGAILEVKIALSLGMKMICAHTLKVLDSPDPKEMDRVPLKYILKSLKREIGYRHSVYKNMVLSGKMKQEEADHEIKVFEQIQKDYKDLKFIGATTAQPIPSQSQGSLFGESGNDESRFSEL